MDEPAGIRLVFKTNVDAEKVVTAMETVLKLRTCVLVSYMKQLCGLKITFADDTEGWGTLDGYTITEVEDGFELRLPDPKPVLSA